MNGKDQAFYMRKIRKSVVIAKVQPEKKANFLNDKVIYVRVNKLYQTFWSYVLRTFENYWRLHYIPQFWVEVFRVEIV